MLWDPDPLPRKVVTGSLTTNEFTIDFVVPSSPVGSHLTAAGCPAVNGYALRPRLPVDVVAAALVLASSPHSVQAAGTITITGSFAQCPARPGTADGPSRFQVEVIRIEPERQNHVAALHGRWLAARAPARLLSSDAWW